MIILRTRNEYKFADEGMNISWKKKKTQTTCQISVNESNYLFQVFSGTNWGNLDRTPL